MGINVHRHGDSRSCGATTIVIGQSSVFINGKLCSVEGDINTHGNGQLIASHSSFKINNKSVIVVGDSSQPDNLGHISIASSGYNLFNSY